MDRDKFFVISLGCPKNQVDSEVLIGSLEEAGYRFEESEDLDFVVINTCGFISDAVEESYATIKEVLNLKKQGKIGKVIVTGCLVQRFREKIKKDFREVDLVLGIDSEPKLPEILKNSHRDLNILPSKWIYTGREPRVLLSPNFAYVKVAEGCNRRCAFCIIPKMRGRYRSRPIEDVIDEIYSLANVGIKEIILVAQDLTLYGYDIYGKPVLDKLIKEIDKIPDVEWVRLMYLYPAGLTRRLVDAIGESEKVVRYIHLPIQHSSDRILKRMRRAGGRRSVERSLKMIRKYIPEFFVRTEVIAGFPGETEEDFEDLYEFLNDWRPERIAIFPYSDEKEAFSSKLDGKVPLEVINDRVTELSLLAQDLMFEVQESFIGQEIRVILDEDLGRTEFDAPEIDFNVKINRSVEESMVDVKVVEIEPSGDLVAELIT